MKINLESSRILHLFVLLVVSGITALGLKHYFEFSNFVAFSTGVTLTVQVNSAILKIMSEKEAESLKEEEMKQKAIKKEAKNLVRASGGNPKKKINKNV